MVESINLAYLILFFLCLFASAFFSSSETAYISLQRVRIRHMVDSGVAGAEEVARLVRQPERLLTTVLIGNNFVNTAAAALGTMILASIIESDKIALIVSTVGVTIVLLTFGEVIPKTVATRTGERMALMYLRPIKIVAWILSPLTAVFTKLGITVARLAGGNVAVHRDIITEEEMLAMISMGKEHGTVEESEADIIERVFRMGDRRVSEIMKPRTNVIGIEKGAKLKDFYAIYTESPHSRFPVYEETMDKVTGILWIKDVLIAEAKGLLKPDDIVTDLARPVYFVPETKIVGELITEMQEQHVPIAVVVDEYGGVAGIVTMEQLLEELVGKLGDELAVGHRPVEKIDRNTYQIKGETRVDQVNEDLGLGLPEGEYETIAGFVLEMVGHIPREGEQFKYGNLTVTVTEMKGVKIEKVLIAKE